MWQEIINTLSAREDDELAQKIAEKLAAIIKKLGNEACGICYEVLGLLFPNDDSSYNIRSDYYKSVHVMLLAKLAENLLVAAKSSHQTMFKDATAFAPYYLKAAYLYSSAYALTKQYQLGLAYQNVLLAGYGKARKTIFAIATGFVRLL